MARRSTNNSILQRDVLRPQANSHGDPPDHPGQCEARWSRRSGIEQQRITKPFILGLMGVAKNTNVWSGTIEKR
ncbi:MAG: hypothetical protein ACXWWB_06160, partial [Nitrospira sp.]